jgi:hypothetical protein
LNWKIRLLTLVKSKTVWGAIFAAIGWLAKQPQLTIPDVITAIGMILTGVGVRDSFTKYLGEGTNPDIRLGG